MQRIIGEFIVLLINWVQTNLIRYCVIFSNSKRTISIRIKFEFNWMCLCLCLCQNWERTISCNKLCDGMPYNVTKGTDDVWFSTENVSDKFIRTKIDGFLITSRFEKCIWNVHFENQLLETLQILNIFGWKCMRKMQITNDNGWAFLKNLNKLIKADCSV